jgi:hypothetical protein
MLKCGWSMWSDYIIDMILQVGLFSFLCGGSWRKTEFWLSILSCFNFSYFDEILCEISSWYRYLVITNELRPPRFSSSVCNLSVQHSHPDSYFLCRRFWILIQASRRNPWTDDRRIARHRQLHEKYPCCERDSKLRKQDTALWFETIAVPIEWTFGNIFLRNFRSWRRPGLSSWAHSFFSTLGEEKSTAALSCAMGS